MSLEISLPLELAPVEKTCMICFEDLAFPVFCRQCKQPACFQCLSTWFAQKRECPKCRCQTIGVLEPSQRSLYSCNRDGLLTECYCEQCNECICRKCFLDAAGIHSRHPVRELDALRKDIMDGISKVRQLLLQDIRQNTLIRIQKLLPKGTPHELVQQRQQIFLEIEKAIPAPVAIVSTPAMGKTPPYVLPNEGYTEHRYKITSIYSDASSSFSVVDHRGNRWTLVVYPRGFSDGTSKFVSMYITLLSGKPGRYEYRYTIFEKRTAKILAQYFALDDFVVGTRSQGCQRLIQINHALQKAITNDGAFEISFGTRPTVAAYGPQCSALFNANKPKSLNFRTFIYTVRDFPQQRAIDSILFSNLVFDQQNMAWRFRVDCNGHQEQGSYLSAFLVLLNGAAGWFDIFIRLVHPINPELSVKRELTHNFTVHSSWGIPHFIDLYQINSFVNQQNQLKFEYGMRPARIDREMM